MKANSYSRADLLAELGNTASSQEGFFSIAQALEVGLSERRLRSLVLSGIVERDDRGIYRFSSYPDTENAELWRAVLWPNVNRTSKINSLGKGVLSHATALDLWSVSTINPSKIDITLPKSYRLRRVIPAAYRIHRATLAEKEITFIKGLPVTTFFRTILDLIVDNRDLQFVDEALDRVTMLSDADKQKLRTLRAIGTKMLDEIYTVMADRKS